MFLSAYQQESNCKGIFGRKKYFPLFIIFCWENKSFTALKFTVLFNKEREFLFFFLISFCF